MGGMTIGVAAKNAGVGVETIRFYEREGLIDMPPKPAGGGFRVYPEDAVGRILFIRQAQEVGFTLREVKELLALRVDPEASCTDIRQLAQAKHENVRQKIAQLKRMKVALERLINACTGEGSAESCSIIGAFEANGRGKNSDNKKRAG